MPDRLFLPILALAALAAIGLSLVWPQGLGAQSPAPFGHPPIQQTAEYQAAMKRQTEAAQRRVEAARASVKELRTQSQDAAK
jgi:hypothetical protein